MHYDDGELPARNLTGRIGLTRTVDGMKDGSIDALFWSGGLPTPGITDLLTTTGDKVQFLDVTGVLADLKKINPAAMPASRRRRWR